MSAREKKSQKATRERRRRSVKKGASSSGPDVFVLSDEVCDRLLVLNYTKSFCDSARLPPMERYGFAVSGQSSRQFPYFAALSSWLLKQIGHDFIEWTEFEDPSAVSNNVLQECRALGAKMDVQPATLRQGWGAGVLKVLDFLTLRALERTRFQVQAPVYPASKRGEGQAEEEEEDIEDDMEEDIAESDIEEDDDELAYDAYLTDKPPQEHHEEKCTLEVMETKIDPREWDVELERVGPRLRVKLEADSQEWRTHLAKTRTHEAVLRETLPDVIPKLEKMGEGLRSDLNRISSKEGHINTQFDHLAQEFRAKQAEQRAMDGQYDTLNQEVSQMTSELHALTEDVETTKAQMEAHSSSMTDMTPLKRIRSTLTQLQSEMDQMELRIGVTRQELLQAKIREQKLKGQKMKSARSGETSRSTTRGESRGKRFRGSRYGL